jgi:phosphoenolpyruvate-protein phosphotransferase (PTS system enzyme I)
MSAVSATAVITNPAGLHARPAVKLTKLAKGFSASLRLRVGESGHWIDAKSVARVLALKAPRGQTLFFEAEGADASEALWSVTELVRRNFDEGSQLEQQFEGQVACAGLAEGFVVLASAPPDADSGNGVDSHGSGQGNPATERRRLESAVERAAAELEALKVAGGAVGSEIIEFQIELLRDSALLDPAFGAMAQGVPAARAFRAAVETQINEYRSSTDKYFAARLGDLADLRARVLAALAPPSAGPAPAAPQEGAIYVAEDLTPSRFLELDWSRWRGAALLGGSTASHVAILARSRGVPLLVGMQATLAELTEGAPALLDAENGRLILNPSDLATAQIQIRKQARALQSTVEARYRSAPAVSASGSRITVQINVEAENTLAGLPPDACDGIGLLRTELLFHDGPPPEEVQVAFYRRFLEWSRGRPVTIRTLDAGGDKPVPGLTVPHELNPFLGVRGVRLCFARPEVFRTQLRALARVAVLGPLKVMLPMVTVPDELTRARQMLEEETRMLQTGGVPAAVPPLGIMVEVPAAALAIARFDAAFYSIGTNDLIQYLTATSRGSAALAGLHDPRNPAVLELIARVAAHGRVTSREVSVCGDMASDPELVPLLLEAGITSLSVAPAALGPVKRAVAAHAR